MDVIVSDGPFLEALAGVWNVVELLFSDFRRKDFRNAKSPAACRPGLILTV